MQDHLDLVRVLDKPTVLKVVGLAPRTWDRLVARGDVPAKTQLSDNRVGYRLIDVMAWLDARRINENGAPARAPSAFSGTVQVNRGSAFEATAASGSSPEVSTNGPGAGRTGALPQQRRRRQGAAGGHTNEPTS